MPATGVHESRVVRDVVKLSCPLNQAVPFILLIPAPSTLLPRLTHPTFDSHPREPIPHSPFITAVHSYYVYVCHMYVHM